MSGSHNNYWRQHELNRVCFGLNADMENSLKELQQQTAKEFNPNFSFFLTSDNFLLHHEGDQVVPSSQRRRRESKPLPPPPPPPPDPEELMSDEAADNEVEFFTSDRRRLLPRSCPKPACRGGSGQVNHAFHAGGAGGVAFSWPGREETARGGTARLQRDHVASRDRLSCSDKPQVPPRIPIPPDDKPPKIPPRVPLVPPCPPRTPSPKCLPIYINGVMPATQSFAANPEYVSKALQRQQSRRAPPPPPAQASPPCIVPILKDGRQASATHYILLPPGRAPHRDGRERLMSEAVRTGPSWQKR